MNLQNTILDLEASAQFQEFRRHHPKAILAHAFQMLDEANKDEIQIGYYETNSGTMFSFFIKNNNIRIGQTNELLKDPEHDIKTLNVFEIKIDSDQALESAKEIWHAEYPKEFPIKNFYILQNIDGEEVYNITFFMHSFKVLNIKISARDKKMVKKSFDSLVNMENGIRLTKEKK